jgi:hypothetical protein
LELANQLEKVRKVMADNPNFPIDDTQQRNFRHQYLWYNEKDDTNVYRFRVLTGGDAEGIANVMRARYPGKLD